MFLVYLGMKTKYLRLLIFFLPIIGCDHELPVEPSINFVGSSECKSNVMKSTADHAADQDCIQFKWVTGDTLTIKHVNAGFNCCPGGFRVSLKLAGDTLVITEAENSPLCDCNCLFDLNYNLAGISKETWWIRVEEPYIRDTDQEKILFKAELRKASQGEFCVTRTGYPWRL